MDDPGTRVFDFSHVKLVVPEDEGIYDVNEGAVEV